MPAILNPRREKFCLMYVATGNGAAAHRAAGYTYLPSSVNKLMKKPDIIARIKELRAEKEESEARVRESRVGKAVMDKTWIVTRLMWLTERSLRGAPIKDAEGNETGKFTGKPDGATAVRCLALAAQIEGLLVNRHELGGAGEFSRYTDKELDARLIEDATYIGIPIKELQAALGRDGVFSVNE